MDEGAIIILSEDDDDDVDYARFCNESSVLIVEEEVVQNRDCAAAPTVLDEDLVVTFTRRADVLPHARYDCPIHPFTATDCEVGVPLAGNQLVCHQCYCYICDKPASSCTVWCHQGVCHCNSHKKSDYWSRLRNMTLLGTLGTFNLTLSEIDTQLRHAESLLQSFRVDLSSAFTTFVKGKPAEEFDQSQSTHKGLIHDYTPVFECVSSFLNKADKHEGRGAAIMRLGAAEDFIQHFHVQGTVTSNSPMIGVAKAKIMLLQRVLSSLQKQMVTELTADFSMKLQDFYKKLYLAPELRSMKNSLCVRPWNDVLLVSVLKGQNVSGVRKDKGKKDVLIEQMPVILLRTELLQRQNRYRELSRYLRVVLADDPKLFQQVQDLVPFFLCKGGDFFTALHCFSGSLNGPAARFTPRLFLVYLHIFGTAAAPDLTIAHSGQLCGPDASWQPVKDAVPLRRPDLVKFALRVQRCCPAVYNDSQSWAHLLSIFNTPAHTQPSATFLQVAKDAVWSVLLDQEVSNIQIPRFFYEDVYSEQALLLLVTGALGFRILDSPLSPALPILLTYKENVWAFAWLCECLASNVERIRSFYQELTQEIQNSTDADYSLSFLHSISPAESSSPGSCDQRSCS
ncbi:uncharacterized protein LOC142996881 isoform X2 [Genypterus blacodes]|uniref:uncharacterized protein LOC142996881 isoform X2 n=1 Tax=Genypterus blacodes TaxID=154954 RepID=UPI003F75E11C